MYGIFGHITYYCRNREEDKGSTQMPKNRFEILKNRVMQRGEESGGEVVKERKEILKEKRVKKEIQKKTKVQKKDLEKIEGKDRNRERGEKNRKDKRRDRERKDRDKERRKRREVDRGR